MVLDSVEAVVERWLCGPYLEGQHYQRHHYGSNHNGGKCRDESDHDLNQEVHVSLQDGTTRLEQIEMAL